MTIILNVRIAGNITGEQLSIYALWRPVTLLKFISVAGTT
jgi:hypothetical protein